MGAENYTPENHVQEGPKTVENKDTQVVEQLNKTGEELNNLIENIDKTNPIVSQNLETAMDNLSQETKDIIKEMMNIPEGQQITAASIKVSAGADSVRWKNFINAQKKYTKSIEQLKTYEQKLGKNNIAQIITEIDSKIGNISKKQSNQTGNRYIIGSRIAQGFISTLENLDYTTGKKPDITLIVDREKCVIGTTGDNANDRHIKVQIHLTTQALPTGEVPQTRKELSTTPTNTQKQTPSTPITPETVTTPKTAAATTPESKPAKGKGGPNGQDIEIKQLDETFQIKEDIARQFTLNGKIDSQNVADIVQNPSDSNRYTATINGYTGFEIKYVGETIEMSPCIVKKGLLKRDQTATLSSKIDRVKQTPETKEISLQLNAEQSKLYINQKLAESTTGDQGVYEVKSAADITDKNIKLIYKNDTILQTIDEKPVEDEITLSLDKDFLINKKQGQNTPITRQKVEGTTEVVTKNDVYRLDNDATKMTYYAKTENGTNNPSIKIINTIIKRTETNTTTTISPLFPEYTNKINQNNTVEKYSKKVNFQYDTPETTSIEKTFQESAHTEYINGGYLLRATFTIKNKTQPLVLSVPAIYTQGTKENQNTSTLNFKQPTLSFSDEYNKIMGDKIMIDGVVYVLYTANSKQKNIPNIIFRHDTEATLEQAKQRTEKYQIQSNIFTNDRKIDEETLNYMQVNAGLGNLQFGPLMVKDGKREDPITYAKDIFVGQVKEDKRIILQGTKLGTMFFDQHGGFLEYKINENQKTFAQQTDKVDLITNTPTGIKNPLGQTNKNILTTTSFAAASSTLNINMLNPNDTYLDTKTGKDFIKEQNSELKSNNFYSSLDIKPIIGKNRITIFEALKTISSDDMNDIKNVFNLVTESAKNVNVVLGPDRNGVYAYKIVQARNGFPAQYIYAKVNEGSIQLCNEQGETLKEQKILIAENNDFYKITVEKQGETQQFKIQGMEKEKEKMLPEVTIDIDKKSKKYSGDITDTRVCNYRSTPKQQENTYQFMAQGYKSFDITVAGTKEKPIIQGTDKIKDISSFSLVDANQEGFGSYRDFFATPFQKQLGISEKTYQEVFSSVFKESDTSNLIKVKYKKGNDYYYMPMQLDISTKGDKNIFNLIPSAGRVEAIKEMEKRLEQLVSAYSVFLEQDIEGTQVKGDTMFGWYLVKPTAQDKNNYFKNPTTKITLKLKTNNTTGEEYQTIDIGFDPQKETIDQQQIIVNNITYTLTLKKDDTLGYKIIVKRGEIVNTTPTK